MILRGRNQLINALSDESETDDLMISVELFEALLFDRRFIPVYCA